MSIKTALFGEPEVEEICNKIARNKKLNEYEKLSKIFATYIKYFNTKYIYDVNFAVFEKYYEYFVLPNGKKDDDKYAKVFNHTMRFYTMCHMETLYNFYVSFWDKTNNSLFSEEHKQLAKNLEYFGQLEKLIYNRNELYNKEPKVTEAFNLINDKILKDCTNGLISIHFFSQDKELEK